MCALVTGVQTFALPICRQYPSRSVHGEADMGDALLTGCTGTCGIATIFFEMCQYQRLPRRLDIGRSLPATWRGDTFWRRCEIGRASCRESVCPYVKI